LSTSPFPPHLSPRIDEHQKLVIVEKVAHRSKVYK
jgi:hypothetical protein